MELKDIIDSVTRYIGIETFKKISFFRSSLEDDPEADDSPIQDRIQSMLSYIITLLNNASSKDEVQKIIDYWAHLMKITQDRFEKSSDLDSFLNLLPSCSAFEEWKSECLD